MLKDSLYNIREEVLNRSLVYGSAFGSLAYLISLTRLLANPITISYLFEFIVIASIIVTTIFRKKLSNAFKAMVFIVLTLAFSFYDAAIYGLLSSARVYIILIPFFSFMYLRFVSVIIIHLFTVIGFIILGYMHSTGMLHIPDNYIPNEYIFKLYPWIINIIHITLVAVIVLIITRMFLKTYQNFTNKLESYNDELAKQVAIQTDDLATANEELKATNEELFLQREELNKALSSLKNAQEKLIDSEKMASLGILTAGVAHEINNPVNFIYNGIQAIDNYLAENDLKSKEAIKPYLDAIDTGIERTVNIVKSLGRYSRSEDLPWSEVDLHEVVDSALLMLVNQYKGRITINKNYTTESPIILANEGQIHQVLLNILLNAIQAIEGEGGIDIDSKVLDHKIRLSIKDSGKGIEEQNLKHIFDPFFTTKDPGQGTGLGLSISKKIILEHNGEIICESAPHKGTTILITFPLVYSKE